MKTLLLVFINQSECLEGRTAFQDEEEEESVVD
jgi:hypothetical protein